MNDLGSKEHTSVYGNHANLFDWYYGAVFIFCDCVICCKLSKCVFPCCKVKYRQVIY